MECNQMRELISAYADGELDAKERAEAERHLGGCAECSRSLETISALKAAMRDDVLLFNVPGALKKKIETMVAKAADPPTGAKGKPSRPILQLKHVIFATAACLALAAGITGYLMWPSARQKIEAQAVGDFKQSMSGNPVVGIVSSDPPTVLRWLGTRLSFSPVTPNRLPVGYALAGGRVDSIEGRNVAVLVYRNGSGTSDLFQWPSGSAVGPGTADAIQGLGAMAWNAAGMNFCVVSDEGVAAVNEMSSMVISQGCGLR
jgi:anti-sigma factor RsiW